MIAYPMPLFKTCFVNLWLFSFRLPWSGSHVYSGIKNPHHISRQSVSRLTRGDLASPELSQNRRFRVQSISSDITGIKWLCANHQFWTSTTPARSNTQISLSTTAPHPTPSRPLRTYPVTRAFLHNCRQSKWTQSCPTPHIPQTTE